MESRSSRSVTFPACREQIRWLRSSFRCCFFCFLLRTNPVIAFFFAMLLFSLAGIPWLAGFFAKWYVFVAAIKSGLFALAVLGVLASVVGAYYYLAIIKTMYMDEP